MKAKKTLFDSFYSNFKGNDDVVVRDISVAKKKKIKLVFINNMISHTQLTKAILSPLSNMTGNITLQAIKQNVITDGVVELSEELSQINDKLLNGYAILFLEGEAQALCIAIIGYEKRSISEPPTSAVLRGPREGFIEDFSVNVSMIRRRMKSTHLKVKCLKVGKISKTDVGLVYLDNVADKDVVNQIKSKIEKIDIDGIIDSYYIQSFLENPHNKFFKQVGNSEKPDIVCSKILEGRVAIIVDGSPIVLTLPYIFFEDFQSADDYYMHPFRATFIRCLRLLGLFLAIMLPGLYVATQSFHYAIFPTNFLVSLLNSIEGLSFPPLIEILLVLFLFEILNEASIRMPKYVGMALSIVGALILGDTAVKAGLISSPSVMMVAISSIAMFTVPDQMATTSMLRVIFTVLGGVAGYYGMLLGVLFMAGYLVSMDSYGSPYLAPFAPHIKNDMKDMIFKKDLKKMKTRPASIPNINEVRMKYDKTAKQ